MSNSQQNEIDLTCDGEERSNSLLANTRCSFCFPCCFGSRCHSVSVGFAWWERVRATSSWSETSPHSEAQPATGSSSGSWWSGGVRAFMKVREWSELAAGPRWKTFIRRFSRSRSGWARHAAGKYQYDPLSYSLNFDEGHNGYFDGDGYDGLRNFSARYAAPPPFKPVSSDSIQDAAVLG
ncbi:uncharacterized protein LOC114416467 [Glycine soja]|uniref:Uncharacterized protein n=1 Tax=Glycine soja TaxID=3848 RepID=A0A445KBJ7_GLYSO|nr:uncharacterized protein LOC114416467 [Glycine soja]RZC08176.1 hypothetical protein D0Y65_015075 [Glycine soja]